MGIEVAAVGDGDEQGLRAAVLAIAGEPADDLDPSAGFAEGALRWHVTFGRRSGASRPGTQGWSRVPLARTRLL